MVALIRMKYHMKIFEYNVNGYFDEKIKIYSLKVTKYKHLNCKVSNIVHASFITS